MSEPHISDKDMVADVSDWVCEAVNAVSNRGFSREHAVKEVAECFSVPLRRVRSMLYGEIFSVTRDEYRRLKKRFYLHLIEEEKRCIERTNAMRAKRARLEEMYDPDNSLASVRVAVEASVRRGRPLGKSARTPSSEEEAQWSLLNCQ